MKNVNDKIRKSANEVIEAIPAGKRKYNVYIRSAKGSLFGYPDNDFDEATELIKKYADRMILWRVRTVETAQTFTIDFSIKGDF